MARTDQLRSRLAVLLRGVSVDPSETVPAYLHVGEWIGFAIHYDEAANVLSGRDPTASDLPRLLLAGHAVECALKACLLAKGHVAPRTHDLVALADLVLSAGYSLQEPDLVAIVHLSSVFAKDLISSTEYRVRYPSKQFEARSRDYAPQTNVSRVVGSLVQQATTANEVHNRHAWSGIGPDA